ncbi:MAG: nuclear transport factor 2 family protein [Actinomycetota bacterium]
MAVVRCHLAAFNERDLEGLRADLAEEVVFATGSDIVSGRAAVCEFFGDALSGSIELELRLNRAIVDGNAVACELIERISSDSGTNEVPIAAFFTVGNGLLRHAKVYREGSADLPE